MTKGTTTENNYQKLDGGGSSKQIAEVAEESEEDKSENKSMGRISRATSGTAYRSSEAEKAVHLANSDEVLRRMKRAKLDWKRCGCITERSSTNSC